MNIVLLHVYPSVFCRVADVPHIALADLRQVVVEKTELEMSLPKQLLHLRLRDAGDVRESLRSERLQSVCCIIEMAKVAK